VHFGAIHDQTILAQISILGFEIPAIDRFGTIASEGWVKNELAVAIDNGMEAVYLQTAEGKIYGTEGANQVFIQEVNFQLREIFGSGAFATPGAIPGAPSGNLNWTLFPTH